MTGYIRRPRRMVAVATATVTALMLAGCSGSDADGGSGKFEYLSLAENTAVKDTFVSLSTTTCSAPEEKSPLNVTSQPQESVDQQLQLLAGQDALPSIFAAGNSPQIIKDINKAGQLVDIGAELEALGQSEAILPAARSTIEALYDGDVYVLPTEFNVEGIWYNKQLFADNQIEVPETWDELAAAAETLSAAGATPFAAAGKDGWPLTRLIGNYIFRSVGPDAMEKVAAGEAKLTDPEYVAGAAAVADLGAKGYFGESVGSIDYTVAMNEFLNGNAAMFYMGSWALGNFNDPSQNLIGVDNVGFMPFPAVDGGAGDSSQLAANIGVPLAMSKTAYNDGAKAWLDCIAQNFGSQSLADHGVITGFAVGSEGADLPPLTQDVQTKIDAASTTVLWLEALFTPKAQITSYGNAQLLVTGQMTPEDFMAAIQADLG